MELAAAAGKACKGFVAVYGDVDNDLVKQLQLVEEMQYGDIRH